MHESDGAEIMKIPIIFDNKYKCWKCDANITVYYPPRIAMKHNLGNIRKDSSTSQESIIGNRCPICDSYQGNHYMWDNVFIGRCYDSDFIENVVWVDEDVICSTCGKTFDENDFKFTSETVRVSTLCNLCSDNSYICEICEQNNDTNY